MVRACRPPAREPSSRPSGRRSTITTSAPASASSAASIIPVGPPPAITTSWPVPLENVPIPPPLFPRIPTAAGDYSPGPGTCRKTPCRRYREDEGARAGGGEAFQRCPRWGLRTSSQDDCDSEHGLDEVDQAGPVGVGG